MTNLLLLFSGLAFFLYGIERLSSLLGQIAGGSLQNMLLKYSSKDVNKLAIGMGVTTLFQSSGATSVILVSMAAAGFITVTEAVSFILGANIGSVAPAWIVVIKVTKAGLPLFILGVAGLFFTRKKLLKNISSFLVGIGLILLGLDQMSLSLAFLKGNPSAMQFLSGFNAENSFGAFFILLSGGIILTGIIQSAGATAAIVMSAGIYGIITLHSAAAVILGSILGTTATGLLAALGSSRDGARVAVIHTGINVLGVIAGAILFYPSVAFTNYIGHLLGNSEFPFLVALYMTIIKVVQIALIWPIRYSLSTFASRIIKERFIKQTTRVEIPPVPVNADIIIIEEILKKNIDILFMYVRDSLAFSYLVIRKPKEHDLFDRIIKYENFIDQGQRKIVQFIAGANKETGNAYWLYMKMADEIESISDHAKAIAKNGIKMDESNILLHEKDLKNVREVYLILFKMFHKICVLKIFDENDVPQFIEIEHEIRKRKKEMLSTITEKHPKSIDSILYAADILAEYNKVNHNLKRILQVNLDYLKR